MLEVVTIAALPKLDVCVFVVVMGAVADDDTLAETRAARVGAVSDVTNIGCANFGNDAM